MNNRATKAEAVALIRQAMALGFTRQVDALRTTGMKPFAVQVNLFHLGDAIKPARQVIVSFRRDRRGGFSVSVQSSRIYGSGRSTTHAGLWDAKYLLANP